MSYYPFQLASDPVKIYQAKNLCFGIQDENTFQRSHEPASYALLFLDLMDLSLSFISVNP